MRRTQPHGYTLIELLMIVALIGIISAIVVPGLLRAKRSGYEASAVSSLRSIVSAQFMYGVSCGNGFFAPTLTALGTAPPGGVPYIGPDLGAADVIVKSAYTVTMGSTSGGNPFAPPSCNGQGAGADTTGYWATATPTPGAGERAFGVNALATIYEAFQQGALAMTDDTAPAGAKPLAH